MLLYLQETISGGPTSAAVTQQGTTGAPTSTEGMHIYAARYFNWRMLTKEIFDKHYIT